MAAKSKMFSRGGALLAVGVCVAFGLQMTIAAAGDDFIMAFKDAAQRKDAGFVLSRVAKDFRWERDFGGGFDAGKSAAANFSAALSLDNSQLRPEYKDIGWQRLGRLLADPLQPNASQAGEVCTTPKDAASDAPSERICFRDVGGEWLISAYIGGGD